MYCYAERHYALCRYAECRYAVRLNVIMLSVVMLNVVAPAKRRLVTTALRRIKDITKGHN